MIKGECTKCGKVVDINTKEASFECPHCHSSFLCENAVKAYEKSVILLSRRGELELNVSTDYFKAYKDYSHLLLLKPESLTVLFNTTLSRLYCSDFHQIYIKEAVDIFINGSDNITISKDNIKALNDDLIRLRKDIKLVVDSFKSVASQSVYALNLYRKSLNEYIYFIDKYLEIYSALDELNKFFDDSLDLLNSEKETAQNDLKIDVKVSSSSDGKHEFYNDKRKLLVNIFPNKKKLFKARIALYIVTGIGALLSIIGFIFLGTLSDGYAKWCTLVPGLVLFIGGYFVGHYLRSKNLDIKY